MLLYHSPKLDRRRIIQKYKQSLVFRQADNQLNKTNKQKSWHTWKHHLHPVALSFLLLFNYKKNLMLMHGFLKIQTKNLWWFCIPFYIKYWSFTSFYEYYFLYSILSPPPHPMQQNFPSLVWYGTLHIFVINSKKEEEDIVRLRNHFITTKIILL